MRTFLVATFLTLFPVTTEALCWRAGGETQPLEEGWSEKVIAQGVAKNGDLVRVYLNEEFQTWSITIVDSSGRECLFTSGEGWRSLKQLAGTDT